jgi:cytochrome c peroxidase
LTLVAASGAVRCATPAASEQVPAEAPVAAVTDPTTQPGRLPGYGPRVFGAWPTVAQMTELGRRIFFDRSLSSSGRMACASCHDPAHAFGPPNAREVQRGGAAMNRPGTRAVPTLRYLVTTIPFTEHFVDDEDGHGEDGGPTGALTWDGRVDSPHEQALIPLFAGHELDNGTPEQLAARVRKAPYAAAFEAAFSGPGERVFDRPERVLGWLAMALEVYQQSAVDFYPYTSKYDAVLRGTAVLSPAEQRGLALFNAPGKGNCASCHPSSRGSGGSMPLFTDSAYVALGVPRNERLEANRDRSYHDLGLCANGRTGTTDRDEYCGRFKTPTLRNVATRKVFFHNGAVHSLTRVVQFYAERDTHPERWYPRDATGRVHKFDDLPQRFTDNVVTTRPFGGDPGGASRLTAAEVRDIVAFLRTLTDGWRAPTPRATR